MLYNTVIIPIFFLLLRIILMLVTINRYALFMSPDVYSFIFKVYPDYSIIVYWVWCTICIILVMYVLMNLYSTTNSLKQIIFNYARTSIYSGLFLLAVTCAFLFIGSLEGNSLVNIFLESTDLSCSIMYPDPDETRECINRTNLPIELQRMIWDCIYFTYVDPTGYHQEGFPPFRRYR